MGAIKRDVLIGIAAAVLASTANAETVYYAVSQGENLARQTWHSGDLERFKQNRPDNVFDLYIFHRLSGGKSKVTRERSTPSGDWFLILTYYYSSGGRLTKMDFDFRTFNGVCPCGETGPIRCERIYSADSAGKLRKESERIVEEKTGATVDWTFNEPLVKHWATLRELPIQPH